MDDYRRLIICCDGTWNRDDQGHDGVPTPTNVRLFHNALDRCEGVDGEPRQVPRYFSGVGADGSPWSRAFDGGTGHGLAANIRAAYLWLATTYRPGDRLSFVGFSRGAFTVRSLVGMIEHCGLLDFSDQSRWADPTDRDKAVQTAFQHGYVKSEAGWQDGLSFHADVKAGQRRDPGSLIEFLGVWDTVGALGIPDFMAIADLFDDPTRSQFHDTKLAAEVGCARHAMALDERRGAFVPTPWEHVVGGERVMLPNDDRVTQLWFPGAHSDVGGGYPEHGLSDGALEWMIAEAHNKVGLTFRVEVLNQLAPDPLDVLHDSCTGLYNKMTSAPRVVPRVDNSDKNTTIHHSAFQRYQKQPVRQDPYRITKVIPTGGDRTCEVRARVAWSETGFFLEPGTYSFTAHGDWSDRGIPGGPAGLHQPLAERNPWHILAELGGRLETMWHHARHDESAQFTGTKRWEDADWMELVGVVAHGAGGAVEQAQVEETDRTRGWPDSHQYIRIGAGVENIVVPSAGYLYAFANDAWGMYDNNRGSVRLTVTRVT